MRIAEAASGVRSRLRSAASRARSCRRAIRQDGSTVDTAHQEASGRTLPDSLLRVKYPPAARGRSSASAGSDPFATAWSAPRNSSVPFAPTQYATRFTSRTEFVMTGAISTSRLRRTQSQAQFACVRSSPARLHRTGRILASSPLPAAVSSSVARRLSRPVTACTNTCRPAGARNGCFSISFAGSPRRGRSRTSSL